ncbi:hypothetical protein [Actinomadura hibisca]|uniref:hypothetical protein n=1 Tax=Actinomadura hibisca TaxID=68565 RepID=UPI00082C0DB2|nr:hypothetical protein [Actinomadura hibisca]
MSTQSGTDHPAPGGTARGRFRRLAAATGLAAALTTAMALPSAAEPAAVPTPGTVTAIDAASLTCDVTTEPGHPVTFSPAVGLLPRRVTVSGRAVLDDCSSPSGRHQNIDHGRLIGRGTALASCTKARDITGQAAITWYDARGRDLGITTIKPNTGQVVGYNPGDALLSGTATSGPLTGKNVRGTATPTSDTSRCALLGQSAIHGKGKMTFS